MTYGISMCIYWLKRIMESICKWNQIYPYLQILNYSFIPYVGLSSFTYCHHIVNGIRYGLFPSDPIKRGPLYLRSFRLLLPTSGFSYLNNLVWSLYLGFGISGLAEIGWFKFENTIFRLNARTHIDQMSRYSKLC